jgi:hypothetical protein
VLGEDAPAEGVDFAEGGGLHSCSFKAKAKSPNARKQVKDF